MASDSEARSPIRYFHRHNSRKGRARDISTPILTFTDADKRSDIYTLPSRITTSGSPRPRTADAAKTRKRIHVADLAIEQHPTVPAAHAQYTQKQSNFSSTSIGVALGSPTHWPLTRTPVGRPSVDSSVPSSFASSTVVSTMQSFGEDTIKPQSTRKLVSRLFGRKPSNAAQNSVSKAQVPYSSQRPQITRQRTESNRSLEALQAGPSPIVHSAPKWNGLGRKASLMLRREQRNTTLPPPHEAEDRPPEPPPKDSPPRPSQSSISSQERKGPLPMLTLDIPDLTLERFSVMFSDVLGPRKSIQARRQTNLKELQLRHEDSAVKVAWGGQNSADTTLKTASIHTPDLLGPNRRATVPSPGSPRILLFPAPPTSQPGSAGLRGPGLSRSNTLPSPNKYQFPEPVYPKRKESHFDNVQSPSHGSDTPISLGSDWQSDDSHELSDISDEDYYDEDDDPESGDIIIQLGDVHFVHELAPAATIERIPAADLRPTQPPSLQPLREYILEDMQQPPGIAARLRSASNQPYSSAPSPVIQRKQSLPISVRPTGPQSSTAPIPRSSSAIAQQVPANPLHFNPLQSSPASPTEITLARQLSLSRTGPRQVNVPGTRTARQPQAVKLINPNGFPQSKDWRTPTAPHWRNKSEHVVLESV